MTQTFSDQDLALMMADQWEEEESLQDSDNFTRTLYEAADRVEQFMEQMESLTDTNAALVLALSLVRNIADGDSINKYNSAHGFLDVALRYQGHSSPECEVIAN